MDWDKTNIEKLMKLKDPKIKQYARGKKSNFGSVSLNHAT